MFYWGSYVANFQAGRSTRRGSASALLVQFLAIMVVAFLTLTTGSRSASAQACQDGLTVSSTECGTNAETALAPRATAVGFGADANQDSATALGAGADALAVSGTAIGHDSDVFNTNGTAVGVDTDINADGGTALGQDANVNTGGTSGIAIGILADVSATSGIAIGSNANVNAGGTSSIAIGAGVNANNSNVTIVGSGASAGGNNATAIGQAAQAGFANSTALGQGAVVARASQMTYGTATNTHTMAGIPSAASTTAQGAVQGIVTTDAAGNLASDGGALQTQANTNTANIAALQATTGTTNNFRRDIDRNSEDIAENREGVAMAMAVAGTLTLPQGINFALTGNWGNFQGDNAIGFSGTARITNNIYFNAGFGAGLRRGTTGGRAGFTALW